jgi:hypothetical protein
MAIVRSLIVGAVLAAFFAGPVFAQGSKSAPRTPAQAEDVQKRKDAEAIDAQYKKTLNKTQLNTTAAPTDPWSNMRGSDDSKTKR